MPNQVNAIAKMAEQIKGSYNVIRTATLNFQSCF